MGSETNLFMHKEERMKSSTSKQVAVQFVFSSITVPIHPHIPHHPLLLPLRNLAKITKIRPPVVDPATQKSDTHKEQENIKKTHSNPVGAFVHIAIVSLSISLIILSSSCPCAPFPSPLPFIPANGSSGGNHVSGAGAGANVLGAIGSGPNVPGPPPTPPAKDPCGMGA